MILKNAKRNTNGSESASHSLKDFMKDQILKTKQQKEEN